MPGLDMRTPDRPNAHAGPASRRGTVRTYSRRPWSSWRMPAAPLLAVLAACGGGGDAGGTGPTDPPGPGPGPGPGPAAPTVSASPGSLTLDGVGATGAITLTVTPASATVSWSVEQTAVASVTGSGTTAAVTAVAAGTTSVVATVTNGPLTAMARVTIIVVPRVRSVAVAPTNVTLLVGATQAFTPTVLADSGASTGVTWSTAAPAIASIDANGLLTAAAPGTTSVRVRSTVDTSLTATATVTVRALPEVRAVVVTPTADSALVGQARQFTAAVTADSGLVTTVTWRTSAPAVATVDGTGRALAVAPGVATLMAVSTADTMRRATATLTVRAPVVRSVTLALAPTVFVGGSAQGTVTIVADSGADQRMEWLSSAPTVASVSDDGLVTGLTPGSATITVRSVAQPSASATATVTVATPPSTTQWTSMSVGAGGAIVQSPIRGIAASASGTGLVVYDGSQGNLTSFVGALEMTGGNWIDRRDAALFGSRFLAGVAASGPTDLYIGLIGNSAIGPIPITTSTVLRWSGGTFSDLGWPDGGATSPRALGMVAPGHLLVAANSGALWRHTGGSWTSVVGANVATSPSALAAWSADSAAVGRCAVGNVNVPLVAVFGSDSVRMLPPVPFTVSALGALFTTCTVDVLARPGGEVLAAFPGAFGRYTSAGGWTAIGAVLEAGEQVTRMAACGDQVFAGTDAGRVLRLQGGTFVEHVAGGIAATGRVGALHCDPGGTLRVGSQSGLVTRGAPGGWVDEHYAPTLRGVHVRSTTQAVIVGDDGLVMQWNGATWTRLRRSGFAEQLNGVWSANDGSVYAIGNSRTLPNGSTTGAQFVRSTGTGFTSTFIAGATTGPSIWGTATNNVLFIVRNHPWIAAAGGIHRWNGSSTSVPFTGAIDSPLAVSGSSSVFALATGAAGKVWLWNGTVWAPHAPIVGAADQALNKLVVFSPTAAFVGNDCIAGQDGGAWRWNGSVWTDAGITAAGFPACVRALFGTGPSDLFAVVGLQVADQRLIRWNGTSWQLVPGADVGTAEGGHGVPGLSVVVKRRGGISMGTPPATAVGGSRRR